MIQNAFRMSWSLVGLWCCTMVWGQCEADHNVIVTNFEFTPSSLTVVPGETVTFINIEGLHAVRGGFHRGQAGRGVDRRIHGRTPSVVPGKRLMEAAVLSRP